MPSSRSSLHRKTGALAAFSLLLILAELLGACRSGPAATPTLYIPTPIPTAVPSETPSATSTDLPTASPEPSASPSPTASPLPTSTATPTKTTVPTPDLTLTPTAVPTTAFAKDTVTMLLIGADSGSYVPNQNTDVLIVVVVNRKTKQVSMLSIPRDLWVNIPTKGYNRINTAQRYGVREKYPSGGPGLLMETIELNLGIHIDHWVRVDYAGFSGAVDTLGGIDLMVPCEINLRYKPPTSSTEEEMILEPGPHHMDGATALRYVRTRRDETDFDRAKRQQAFLKAVWSQFKDPGIILKIPSLWSSMKDYIETDMGLGDILALAPLALDVQRQHIRNLYISWNQVQPWTTPQGWEVLLPIPAKIQQVVDQLYSAPAAEEDAAASEAARIAVQNGTDRAYLAEIAADSLRWYGFSIVSTGSAGRSDFAKTQVIVFKDKPKTLEELVTQLKVKPANVIQQPDPQSDVDLLVILGADYSPCP